MKTRSARAALQVAQQVEDLRLDRDVERRDRLVGDEQLGVERERARDADALALAARELVRVAVVVLGVQPDRAPAAPARALRRPALLAGRGSRAARRRSADRLAGVQRGVGVLEDDLQLAPERLQLGALAGA